MLGQFSGHGPYGRDLVSRMLTKLPVVERVRAELRTQKGTDEDRAVVAGTGEAFRFRQGGDRIACPCREMERCAKRVRRIAAG